MKNVKFIFVLLLFINCTTDTAAVDESSEAFNSQPESQNCVDELPKVRLTNNSTQNFDFIVYGVDYSVLHTQSIAALSDSGWIEILDNDITVVATNDVVYGQKLHLSVLTCDVLEMEIDVNSILSVDLE